jgi:ketosteroid isomerase-like protein
MVVRTGTLSEQENVRFVRRIWAAIERRGIEGALELTEPSVEWKPHVAEGRVFTSGELLQFFREFQGERELLEAKPYSFFAKGDLVLGSGSFRLRGRDRLSDFQIHWVYKFDGTRLVRACSYGTRREALAAMGMTEEEISEAPE